MSVIGGIVVSFFSLRLYFSFVKDAYTFGYICFPWYETENDFSETLSVLERKYCSMLKLLFLTIVSLTCTISGAFPAVASTVTCLCDTNQWGNEQELTNNIAPNIKNRDTAFFILACRVSAAKIVHFSEYTNYFRLYYAHLFCIHILCE